jgi:pyruvate formate lyase activating enzyme
VLAPHDLPDVPLDEIWAFLDARRGLLDGVVISGGEPTLQPDLLSFCRRVREMGYAVKLDTNGYRPSVLREALETVDYVAMDVKAPLQKYALAAGVPIDGARIEQSVDLLFENGRPFEFRTTVVPGLLGEAEIVEIATWLAGKSAQPGETRYYLQQFVPRDTLDPAMRERMPYIPQRLRAMADLARQWLLLTQVRGI